MTKIVNPPLASIALICYNQENTIVDALQSSLSQDYKNFELIISDDCSDDNTVDVINSFINNIQSNKIKIRLNVNDVNLGIGGNLAKAVSMCTGEFIIPASGDDISASTRVSTVMSVWLESNKQIGFINTDLTDISLTGEIIKERKASNFNAYRNLQDWLKKPQFFSGTECWSSDFYKKFSAPINVRAEDQIMSFRAILLGCGHTIHQSTLYHRLGGVTDKKPKSFAQKIESLRQGAKYSYADYSQLWLDALSVGKEREVESFLKSKISEAELITKCFSKSSKLYIFLELVKHPRVKITKKIRYFSYIFLPFIHKLIYKLKNQMR
jgi:glycosyltransferase involved in cell wall biosynthesis